MVDLSCQPCCLRIHVAEGYSTYPPISTPAERLLSQRTFFFGPVFFWTGSQIQSAALLKAGVGPGGPPNLFDSFCAAKPLLHVKEALKASH
jgi:hypothetical protein